MQPIWQPAIPTDCLSENPCHTSSIFKIFAFSLNFQEGIIKYGLLNMHFFLFMFT